MEADKEEKKTIEKIAETTDDIFETYRKLMAITLVEYTTLGASTSVVGIAYLIFVVFALLFVGLGSAWWLGESLSNMKAGFFIVSGAYTAILLILLLVRKKIISSIRNLIIKEIYDTDC